MRGGVAERLVDTRAELKEVPPDAVANDEC